MNEAPTAAEVRRSVTRPHSRRLLYLLIVLVLVGGAAAAAFMLLKPAAPATTWATRPLDRGDIVSTATATGNLQPRTTVTVGAEISGLIKTVDVEDSETVKAGQLLATFDTTDLKGELQLARASLASSNASVRRAVASNDEAAADLARTKRLVERGVTASADLDAASATTVRAKADLDKARADASRARATVADVQARLGKAEIRSPIDGVILERNVEPGQTVASSLQAPELFVVAEDLSRMELQIWIDESDVGVVKPGQTATFEVSAWPNRRFDATVESVDISPTMTDNVVTYMAVLSVDNSDGLLRPGMSAAATITTERHADVLRVPNAALRFQPTDATADSGPAFSLVPQMGRRRSNRSSGQEETRKGGMGHVYVVRGAELARIRVQTGDTDGTFTEITSDELSEGDEVVVGIGSAEPAAAPRTRGARSAP